MIDDPHLIKIAETFAKIVKDRNYYNEECFKELTKAVKGYYNEPCFLSLVNRLTSDFAIEISSSEPGILSLLEDGADRLQSIQDNVGIIWGQALKTLDYKVDLLRWSLLRVDPRSNFAIFAIASNGLCVASEISWLLRGGFADGASARQRTLFELVSVTGFMIYVAREIDKDIGTRWLDSLYVIRYKYAHRQIRNLEEKKAKSALSPEEESFYTSNLPAYRDIKAKYDEVINKHGTGFEKQYGWAKAAVEKINDKRVTDGLKKIPCNHSGIREITLPFLESLHIIGNFAVHGGEEPIRSLYPIGGHDNKTSFTLGPTIYGIDYVIGNTARLVHILAAFVTFAFNTEDSAIASAMIKALDIKLKKDINECVKNKDLLLKSIESQPMWTSKTMRAPLMQSTPPSFKLKSEANPENKVTDT